MITYKVYLIGSHGEGRVISLPDWDGQETLELVLSVYARDSVISIEPHFTEPGEEE